MKPDARILLALAATLMVGGCTQDQAPFNRLTSLRVLAMRSEPAAPAPGETATLSALIYAPPGDPPVAFSWQWCPFPGESGDGYKCLVDEAQLQMFGAVPAFDLGIEETAMLANSVDPAALAAICAGVPGAPVQPDCKGGFPIQLMFKVTNQTETVVAVVTSRWRFPDPMTQELQTANANPTVDGLSATVGQPPPQPMPEDAPVFSLPRDTETRVQADIAESASEPYDGFADDGTPAPLQERLFATWFIESGDTGDRDTSFIPGRTPFDPLLKNGWTPARRKDYAPSTARLYVVIHDNRGGVGWRSGIVNLDDTP